MFILRKISGCGVEGNTSLGNHYTVVLKDRNPEAFEETKETYGSEWVTSNQVYGFVTSEGGKDIHCLYPKQGNYIMTESGSTFDNLTLK